MRRSLRSWLWRVPIDQEVEEELALHAELRRREGRPLDAAELAAVRLACVDIARKRDREMRLTRWLEELGGDVRFALRQLRRAPGFTFVVALTLALGIGANSAMFALADVSLIRPLPFADPGRLVMVKETAGPSVRTNVSPANFLDWSERNVTFQSMAAYNASGHTIIADGVAELIPGLLVSNRFFDVLGIRPVAGRTFRLADASVAPNVVVVSEALWRTRFGGDASFVGRQLRLGARSHTVIGIVPAEMELFAPMLPIC